MKPVKKIPNLFFDKKNNGTYFYTKQLYGSNPFSEDTVERNGNVLRYWDPGRSKLAAAFVKGAKKASFTDGDVVLYLGAGHGYTSSYVSDIVGGKGMVFALDFAPRVVRDLVFVCEERANMAPIMGDANKPDGYEHLVPEQCDVLFQDISQKNQSEIFLKNVDKFLKHGGVALLALKAHSIDVNAKPSKIFDRVEKELSEKVDVLEQVNLEPFEKGHALFVCRKR